MSVASCFGCDFGNERNETEAESGNGQSRGNKIK